MTSPQQLLQLIELFLNNPTSGKIRQQEVIKQIQRGVVDRRFAELNQVGYGGVSEWKGIVQLAIKDGDELRSLVKWSLAREQEVLHD